jgi:hypothetical protein
LFARKLNKAGCNESCFGFFLILPTILIYVERSYPRQNAADPVSVLTVQADCLLQQVFTSKSWRGNAIPKKKGARFLI